ncbi:hypothetical protein O9K51_08378 [Purpureocillium lavendulum]|uniref:Uncharacterized protein n=1 Tax=Purpureocillium lavendulum TaxID=1247861 RepID=A0AB34FL28_9HYPO|nr:hypothetical protein O9K51_08378 [Purpureocillium lavendulum]
MLLTMDHPESHGVAVSCMTGTIMQLSADDSRDIRTWFAADPSACAGTARLRAGARPRPIKLELRAVATEARIHSASSSAGMLTRVFAMTPAPGLIPALTPLYRLGFSLVIARIVGVAAGLGSVVRYFEVSRDLKLPVVGIEARPAPLAGDNSRVADVKQHILNVLSDC